MLGIAAVALTRHSLADAISNAKAERKNDLPRGADRLG